MRSVRMAGACWPRSTRLPPQPGCATCRTCRRYAACGPNNSIRRKRAVTRADRTREGPAPGRNGGDGRDNGATKTTCLPQTRCRTRPTTPMPVTAKSARRVGSATSCMSPRVVMRTPRTWSCTSRPRPPASPTRPCSRPSTTTWPSMACFPAGSSSTRAMSTPMHWPRVRGGLAWTYWGRRAATGAGKRARRPASMGTSSPLTGRHSAPSVLRAIRVAPGGARTTTGRARPARC